MRALDVQGVQQGQHVTAQLLDAVRPGRHQRTTMTTGVETQYPKMLGKQRDLPIPHVQVSAQ